VSRSTSGQATTWLADEMRQPLLHVCGAIVSIIVFTGSFLSAIYSFGRWESKADG
jgi:hypothetical protein